VPRVSKESLEKLNAFIDSLPVEARNKCALCNETLVHLVKTAEVESGAGTATVTRALADRINEDAAPADRVKPENLRRRVRYQEDDIRTNCPNNPQPQHDPPEEKEEERPAVESKPPAKLKNWRENKSQPENDYMDYDLGSMPMRYARMAVLDLEKIENSHPDRNKAFDFVIEWINNVRR
jgi:hypothetical protein